MWRYHKMYIILKNYARTSYACEKIAKSFRAQICHWTKSIMTKHPQMQTHFFKKDYLSIAELLLFRILMYNTKGKTDSEVFSPFIYYLKHLLLAFSMLLQCICPKWSVQCKLYIIIIEKEFCEALTATDSYTIY
jgi:hypothetical protein